MIFKYQAMCIMYTDTLASTEQCQALHVKRHFINNGFYGEALTLTKYMSIMWYQYGSVLK